MKHRDLKHLISNKIPYVNRPTNPVSENTKISTWNHHNFLTSETILIKLEILIIVNIDSESIAGVLSSGNHKQKTFFYKVFLVTTSDITSTYFIGIQDQIREAAQVLNSRGCRSCHSCVVICVNLLKYLLNNFQTTVQIWILHLWFLSFST